MKQLYRALLTATTLSWVLMGSASANPANQKQQEHINRMNAAEAAITEIVKIDGFCTDLIDHPATFGKNPETRDSLQKVWDMYKDTPHLQPGVVESVLMRCKQSQS